MGFTQPDTPPQRPDPMPASTWDIQAPYDPGTPAKITVGGDADAGGTDVVAGDPASAAQNANARWGELQSDTYGQGSKIGDQFTLPPNPLDPGVGSLGEALPAGHYYDPPRSYDS